MKKVLLAMAAACCALTVNAQKLSLIPKAGISIATQNIKGTNDEKSKVGFQGGVALNIQTGSGRFFTVQPELNFVSKGATFKTAGKKSSFNLNYVEVPLLAKLRVLGPVYLNAGPSVGLLLGKSKKVEAAYGNLKSIDFGVQMGGSIELPVGPGRLVVDGRYALGLNNISEVKGVDIKNRAVMVSVGYAIPL